jgi:hypothetical protein
MQIILKQLDINDGIEVYKKRIYQFTEPLKPSYNIAANKSYSSKVLQNLENKVLGRGMIFDFPDFLETDVLEQARKIIIILIIKTIKSNKLPL